MAGSPYVAAAIARGDALSGRHHNVIFDEVHGISRTAVAIPASLHDAGVGAALLAQDNYVSIVPTASGWGIFGTRLFADVNSTSSFRFINVYRQYEDILTHPEQSAAFWLGSNIQPHFSTG